MRHFLASVIFSFGFLGSSAATGQARSVASAPGAIAPGAIDATVPTPSSILGFEPGSRPARHEEIVRYFEAIAAATKRARVQEYARSHEGRRLVHLTVSAEENMARLDEIRKALARLGDPRGLSAAEANALVERTPASAWLAYSVHGNELSGADAALLVAYRLCSGLDAETTRLRRELVVQIDAPENPDGRERFLAQVTAISGVVANPDAFSINHTSFWPWGRWNHYFFDLNRDYIGLTQPEIRGRVAALVSWSPQLLVDAHEMGADSSFLFSPARHPFNPQVPPNVKKWGERFAREQAAAFDVRGWSYYTREWNEEFFPGFASSWAKNLGAVGILYEQARTDGTLVRQQAGTTLTFAQTVSHQFVSSLANLETAARNRRELLSDWAAGRKAVLAGAAAGKNRAYLIPLGQDSGRSSGLVRTLLDHGLEVHTNDAALTASNLHEVWSSEKRSLRLPSGSFLVRLDQPLAPLAKNLLDFHQPLSPDFLREERAWLERDKGSRLYETTAWSLPLFFGVATYWSEEIPAGPWRKITSVARPAGKLEHGAARFGYLFGGSTDSAIFLAGKLLEEGFVLRAGREPFRYRDRSFERGAFLLKREENPGELSERLKQLAEKYGVDVLALESARVIEGSDFGGNDFRPLLAPRIAVLTGAPISPSSYGSIWHLLDRQVEVRFSGLDVEVISQADLSRYNVLVFPQSYEGADGWKRCLGKAVLSKLKTWIETGGTAVGIGNGAEFLADPENGFSAARPRRLALAKFPPVVLGLDALTAEAAGLFAGTGVRATPEPKDDKEKKETARPAPIQYPTPYDVPPVVGPGALPFLPNGTATYLFPQSLLGLEEWLKPLAPPKDKKTLEAMIERADLRLRRFNSTGAFLKVDLDPEQWLAYGSEARVPVFFSAEDALVAAEPVTVAGRFGQLEHLHLSGLLWPEAAGRIAKTAYLTREAIGSGQIVLFADDPAHWGMSFATERLLLNALFLGPGLGTSWKVPW